VYIYSSNDLKLGREELSHGLKVEFSESWQDGERKRKGGLWTLGREGQEFQCSPGIPQSRGLVHIT
jgi:hypothetical protein